MTPSNRRIRPAAPPPDVLEVAPPPPPVASAPEAPSVVSATASRLSWLARDAAGLVMVVATSVGVAWAAERYVTTSPRFAVTEVTVSGTQHRAREAVLELAAIRPGDNVFSVDLDAAEARLEKDAWIAEASLTRRLPDTIVVEVKERHAAAIVSIDGEAWLATQEGDLFKRVEPGDPADFPVVTGLTSADASHDRAGVSKSIVRALDVAAEYERSSLAQRMPLEEVHVSKARGLSLIVGRGATELVLGGPPYRRKLEEAARVNAELERRGSHADAIFLDNEARPDRVVARVK